MNVILAQRKFYVLIGATLLGVLLFGLIVFKADSFKLIELTDLFKEWVFYEIGIVTAYMAGNAFSKFAQKNEEQ